MSLRAVKDFPDATSLDIGFELEQANVLDSQVEQLQEALVRESTHEYVVLALAKALRDAAIEAELQWRKLEEMPEYKRSYASRKDARRDYLMNYAEPI